MQTPFLIENNSFFARFVAQAVSLRPHRKPNLTDCAMMWQLRLIIMNFEIIGTF